MRKVSTIFKSRSSFFVQYSWSLKQARINLEVALRFLGRSKTEVNQYLIAFDYFVINPKKFDGATIVRDLYMLRSWTGQKYVKLSPDAMLHDYEYIMGANRSFTKKWKSDCKYFRNLLLNGKGVCWGRWLGLTIISPIYVPYKYIKHL